MTTDAILAGNPFTLHRFPLDQKNRSLQAWDSADEYLLDYVFEHHHDANRILILNDSFGALCCALADKHCTVVTDSYVSILAYQHNLHANALSNAQINVLTSMDPYPQDIDLILMKIPKNSGLLQSQLAKLSKLAADIPVIAAGKAKEIHTSTLKSFTHFLTEPTTSLAVKKSRLVFSRTSAKAIDSKFPVSWPLEKTDFTLSNEANVFSRDSLDIGARFFINYLPMGKKPLKVIDLGCGNGVIGLMTLARVPNASVTFIDESAMAVHSAKHNISHNLPERVKDCRFVQNDCLSGFENEGADLVLCNPPFHQANAITDHIAWQMFMQAKAALRQGGELRIIGNRHLEYYDKLKRLFGNAKILGNNKKFTVLSAIKRS